MIAALRETGDLALSSLIDVEKALMEAGYLEADFVFVVFRGQNDGGFHVGATIQVTYRLTGKTRAYSGSLWARAFESDLKSGAFKVGQ